MNDQTIAVAIYTHPELFPPVLNAVDELAEVFDSVWIISRNLIIRNWKYPENVQLVTSGKYISIRDSEKASMRWKIKSFLGFVRVFRKTLKRQKPAWVMCNDPISLYAFRLIRPFLGYPVRLWYHNHDVVELESQRKFSVGWFAGRSEKKQFHRINLFTLPAQDRLKYFPMNQLKGESRVVPNYPSIRRMGNIPGGEKKIGRVVKLLYQGHIGEGHGLKEIIDFIKTDSSIRLTIVGPGNETFIQFLRTYAAESRVSERVSILDPVPYAELSVITRSHQVGLAIHEPVNTAFRTAALASNKIYEYAAAGLPVLYYGDQHYINYLAKYSWCFPTKLTMADLSDSIQKIRENYPALSEKAVADFQNHLNFAVVFQPVLSFISKGRGADD